MNGVPTQPSELTGEPATIGDAKPRAEDRVVFVYPPIEAIGCVEALRLLLHRLAADPGIPMISEGSDGFLAMTGGGGAGGGNPNTTLMLALDRSKAQQAAKAALDIYDRKFQTPEEDTTMGDGRELDDPGLRPADVIPQGDTDVADAHLARILRHRLKQLDRDGAERDGLERELQRMENDLIWVEREIGALRAVLRNGDYDEHGEPIPGTRTYKRLEAEAKEREDDPTKGAC